MLCAHVPCMSFHRYVAFGVLCYLFFKGHTSGIVFDNIDCGSGPAAVGGAPDATLPPCRVFSPRAAAWLNAVVKASVGWGHGQGGVACAMAVELLWSPGKHCIARHCPFRIH